MYRRKNKNISIHIIILLGFIFSCQFSWSQNANIDIPFIKNYQLTSVKEKMAYNDKVVTKVEDFYNYLEIISNPKIEKRVRLHTIKLTKKLFLYNIELVNILSDKDESIKLYDFLNQIFRSKEGIKFEVSNANFPESGLPHVLKYDLVVISTSGRLNFQLNQSWFIHSTQKKFGNNSREVVETNLGKIFR